MTKTIQMKTIRISFLKEGEILTADDERRGGYHCNRNAILAYGMCLHDVPYKNTTTHQVCQQVPYQTKKELPKNIICCAMCDFIYERVDDNTY